MNKLFFFIIALFFCNTVFAQDAATLIKEGQRLETVPDEKAAFAKYKEALKVQPQNLIALTRCSEICSNVGNRETSSKNRDAYYNAGLVYAQTALKLHPESDLSNVAMAIAVGRIVLTKSGKEKVASVKDLKNYAEKAIKANPNNFRAWHILGKWHYEVSNLSAFERTAAKILFGALPAASFASAITSYEKAKALNPGFILNHLELAKALKKNGDKTKALAELNTVLALKNVTEDDARIKIEAQGLIKKWE
jgi:tetratricopeptide (TPR) repeat protein